MLALFTVCAASGLWLAGASLSPPAMATTQTATNTAASTDAGAAPAAVPVVPTGATRSSASAGRSPVGGSIRGRTVRADGTSVANVEVVASGATRTRSDANGQFAVEALPAGTYCLTAIADRCAGVPSGAIVLRGGDTIDGVDLVVERACFVLGRVTTGDAPLAEARVSGRLRDASVFPDLPPGAFADSEALLVVTGADGAFRLGPFPPGRIELRVEHDDCLPFARGYASDAGGLEIALPRARYVAGTVLAPDGTQPAVIECVQLRVPNGNRPGTSVMHQVVPAPADSAAGRFRLALPPVLPGDVCVVAVVRNFAPAVSEPLRLQPGQQPSPLVLRAQAGCHLRGRAHDGQGAPIRAEITVREEGSSHEAARLVADAEGRFDCVLLPGPHLVDARLPGCMPRQEQVEIRAGEDATLDLAFERGGALTGRVSLASGAVVPALEVQVSPSDQPDAPPLVTPVGEGSFAFDYLPPGEYRVALRERGERAPGGDTVAVRVISGETARIDLAPVAHGFGRLRGDVTHNGVPLPFVTVLLTRGTNKRMVTVTADRCGQFEVEALAAGPLTVAVHHGEHGPVLVSRRLELKAGEDRDEQLAVAFGAIAGRVLDAVERIALSEMRVDVLGAGGAVLASARTGADGRFRLPVVQAGDWTIGVAQLGEDVALRKPVRVAAGQIIEVPDLLCPQVSSDAPPEHGAAGAGQAPPPKTRHATVPPAKPVR